MRLNQILKSETTGWAFGAVALAVLSGLAFSVVGWLGVGLVGLVGLVISTRIDLHGGHALNDSGFGSGDVPLYVRQLAALESQSSPEQRLAQAAARASRSRILYLLNTVLIGMTALGFGLFLLHQF